MRIVFILAIVISLIGCQKDKAEYPKSYSFARLDQNDESLYVVSANNTAVPIDLNTGTYGLYREEIKQQSSELIESAFNIQEIVLLSENMVRLHILFDEEVIDTVLSYTKQDEQIIIEELAETDFFEYDPDNDRFLLCGFTTVAIPGPNTPNPDSKYNIPIIEDCIDNASAESTIAHVLNTNDFVVGDTIGLLFTRFHYE